MARGSQHLTAAVAVFIASAYSAQLAFADGSDKSDFSLRFPAALGRFSPYADVAATGGASAGSKWQSSVNPAATAWQDIQGSRHWSFSPQYSQIAFHEGTVLQVLSGSITRASNRWGTSQVTLAHARSNDRAMRAPLPDYRFSYHMDYLQCQWGRRLFEAATLGASVSFAPSEVTTTFGAEPHTRTSSDTYGLRVGALYRAAQNLLAGIVVDYSQSPSATTTQDIFEVGIGGVCVDDRTRQFSVRAGSSYEYRQDSTVNLDYQYGSLENDTGGMDVHRMLAGVDHRIADALFARAGCCLDHHSNMSWTGGLGIYLHRQISTDVGYQYDMFPEIKSEFGTSDLVTVSVSVSL
jgi:hypothetical protein